jgi:hypothetical protein
MSHPLKIFMAITFLIMLTSLPVLGADLTSYRWKNRLLLVFSPTESDPGFAAFDPNVSRELAAVKDRDLIVFRVFEKGPSRVDEHPLSSEDAQNLRRRFEVGPGRFTVILIGKDGGVKMVREHRAELQEIFDLIDSMPMRQREMREKGKTP